MENQVASAYLVKMEGTRNLLMIQEAKEIWEFCLANQITLTGEYLPGTLNARADKPSREMKNSSSEWILNKPIFQKLMQALGPVCIQVVPPNPKVHKLATKSTCMDGGCISNKLETPKSIHLPTFCSYKKSVSQSNKGQVYVDRNNTSMAFPTMVHPVIENVYTRSSFHFPVSKSFDRPKPKPTPIVSESNISLSSMEGFWQQCSAEGLSDQTTDCLKVVEDRAHSIITERGGESGVAGVFQERNIDPVPAGVNCVLEFLSNLFSEELEYRTINGYSSAISAYHEKAEGIPIGQHPKVCQLLSGVFNKRPPQPKYTGYFQGN